MRDKEKKTENCPLEMDGDYSYVLLVEQEHFVSYPDDFRVVQDVRPSLLETSGIFVSMPMNEKHDDDDLVVLFV